MPTLEELLTEKSKKNIMKNKSSNFSTGSETIKGSVSFIGQTPNLNSSLGVNAFSGYNATGTVDPVTPTTTTTTDKSFLDKNQGAITNIASGVLGTLFGGGASSSSSGSTYVPPADDTKKIMGMPAWLFWTLLVILIIVIIFVIIKMKK